MIDQRTSSQLSENSNPTRSTLLPWIFVVLFCVSLSFGLIVVRSPRFSPPTETALKEGAATEPTPSLLTETGLKKGPGPELRKERTAEDIYALASPGVVTITLKNDDGDNIGLGSGFFLMGKLRQDQDAHMDRRIAEFSSKRQGRPVKVAYLVTNYHVIHGAVDAEIALHDGSKGRVVRVVTEHESADLALLCVYVYSNCSLTELPMANETPPVGAGVFAIGSPRGLKNSLSAGMVSGNREIEPGVPWLQTTAPISPGSSGGALLNSDGNVVGVTTAVRRDGQNLNFAVPVSELRQLLASPYRKRELWKGRSIRKEIDFAFDGLPFEENTFGEILRKARNQIANRNFDDAIATLENEKPFVESDFCYLCYFLLGRAHSALAPDIFKGARGTIEEVEAAFRNSNHGRLALEALKQAQRLNPSFAPTYDRLSIFYSCAGQKEQALQEANSLVKLMPQCAKAYERRGFFYSRLHRYSSALKDYRLSLRLNPINPRMLTCIGDAYLKLEEYDKAVESYRAAIAQNHPQAAVCQWGIGEAYRKAGKYQQAIRAYEEAQTLGLPFEMCEERISFCRAMRR